MHPYHPRDNSFLDLPPGPEHPAMQQPVPDVVTRAEGDFCVLRDQQLDPGWRIVQLVEKLPAAQWLVHFYESYSTRAQVHLRQYLPAFVDAADGKEIYTKTRLARYERIARAAKEVDMSPPFDLVDDKVPRKTWEMAVRAGFVAIVAVSVSL